MQYVLTEVVYLEQMVSMYIFATCMLGAKDDFTYKKLQSSIFFISIYRRAKALWNYVRRARNQGRVHIRHTSVNFIF